MNPIIFISYSHKNFDIVDKIDKDLSGVGIRLKRDVRDLKPYSGIKEFMKSIKGADFVLIVISDGYLKSPNCLYEVLELIKDDNYKEKIIPIFLDDANIFDLRGKSNRIKYWQDEKSDLMKELKALDPQNIGPLTEQLRIIDNITSNLSNFIDSVTDILNIPLTQLQKTGYKEVLQKIGYNNQDLISKLIEILEIEDQEDQDIEIDNFIRANNRYSLGYFAKGYISNNRGKYKKAINNYDKAIEIDPKYATAYYNKACAYSLQSQKQECLTNLEICIAIDTSYKLMAKEDEDFKNLWSDEDFKKLTDNE